MRKGWPLNELSWQEFEKLTILLCERILGTGTILFAEGKDGGRDAVFKGAARRFPSESKPWEGKFIVQAKHTGKRPAKCSDPDFQGILKKEVKKLNKLIRRNEVDYYLIFTNRQYSGVEYGKISDFIDSQFEENIETYIIAEEDHIVAGSAVEHPYRSFIVPS
ncbi:MAG: restriction endonuclease [bacterium]|nr:restriction endonuclease [bacterium]